MSNPNKRLSSSPSSSSSSSPNASPSLPPHPLVIPTDYTASSLLTTLSTNIYPSTIPPSLTRSILRLNGLNFATDAIPQLVAVAADKVMKELIDQAIACRDKRLEEERNVRKSARREEHQAERRKAERLRKAAKTKKRKKGTAGGVENFDESSSDNEDEYDSGDEYNEEREVLSRALMLKDFEGPLKMIGVDISGKI